MKSFLVISRVLLGSMVFVMAIVGCSKDSDGILPTDGYFLKFKLDGTNVSYENEAFEFKLAGNFNARDNSDYAASALGSLDDDETDRNQLLILIGHESEIQANLVYTNKASATPKIESKVFLMTFLDENGASYVAVNEESLKVLYNGVADAEVVFTEVGTTSLKGRFSGSLYNEQGKISITNGEFYVPRTDVVR